MSCDYLTCEVFKYLRYKLFPCDEKMRHIKHASKETNNLLLKITDFFFRGSGMPFTGCNK